MKFNIFKSFLLQNYSLLLFVVILIFVVPLFPVSWHNVLFNVFFTMIYLMAPLTMERNRKPLLFTAIVLMFLLWVISPEHYPVLNAISKIITILFFSWVVVSFIIMISRSKIVSTKLILESINGYLMMGLMFTLIIAIIQSYNPDAFSFPEGALHVGKNVNNFSNYLYYTLVTISTLGYGDVLPTAQYAKSLATFISISGQLYIAIIVANLVGKFASQNIK